MDIVQVADSMLENDQTKSHENAPGHSDEEMEITADDNTKPTTWESLPLKHDKEIQTFNFQTIKTFRTISTQTEQVEKNHPVVMHPDDVNPVQHLEDHNYSLGQVNGQIMTDAAETGEQSTNHLVELPNILMCKGAGKQGVTDTPESGDVNLEDNTECCSYQHLVTAESDSEVLESSDSEYFPSDSEGSENDDDNSQTLPKQKKFIVFENELLKLFKFCQQCGSPTDTTTMIQHGSMATVKTSCMSGHMVTWKSQPQVKGTAAGNLLITAAIVFSGNTYKHAADFAKQLNLQFISSSYYYKIQRKIIFPVIQKAWKKNQAEVVKQLKQNKSVDLCGDGRCDSPGHSAKYGTYTLMDEKSNLIVEFSLVQVTEVSSSNAMEYEGCKRSLNSVIKKKVPIRCLTTDRHTTITAKMRTVFPTIDHQYDVWHLSKWVTKKLSKKAKKKGCEELTAWIQCISNHLWWCAATCNGQAEVLREKWLSMLEHIVNKHTWKSSPKFQFVKKCGHAVMSRREKKSITWLKKGSPSLVALEEVVTNQKLLKDLAKLTEFHHTGQLESYHSLMTKYVPKREHFSYNGMVARTQLAILDHNANTNRSQAEVKKGPCQGEKRYKLLCAKQRKNWVVKEIKTPKVYGYIEDMMDDVILCQEGKKFPYKPTQQAKHIAPTPKPCKQDIIEKHQSRSGMAKQ